MLGISVYIDLYIDYTYNDIGIESFKAYCWRHIWLRAE
jgi:hypothetical protein